jgi:RHS repeat-associated protein
VLATRGGQAREISSAPLRVASAGGAPAPVDLALVSREGGFSAVRPLVPFSISGDAAGGVTFGSSGLRVAMVGRASAGELVNGRDAFFPEVAEDTDAVVAPKLYGVDLLAVLRSSLSPSDLHYRVSLPAGATLQPVEGAVNVVQDARVLAEISSPEARDAQGSAVPVRMRVSGRELVVEVLRRTSVDYPLLVDPGVVDITESSENWSGELGERFCGSPAPFSLTAPGKGTAIKIALPATYFPLSEEPHCSEFSRNYEYASGWWRWHAPASFGVTEFYGVSFSGRAVSVPGEAETPRNVEWHLDAGCYKGAGRGQSGYLNQPPALVETVGGTAECPEGDVGLGVLAGEITPESGPTYVEASLSVESILLTEYEAHPERLGESYGTDNPGEPDRQNCTTSDPVECASGNKVETQTDLSVGGRGPALGITRTYNSRLAASTTEFSGHPFGVGWSFPYGAHLTGGEVCEEHVCTGRRTLTVVQGNGSSVQFVRESGGVWVAVSPLAQATLTEEGEDYVYTLPDQTVQRFSKSHSRLESETDRNGNTLTMQYAAEYGARLASVTGPGSRKLTFTYNELGFIESVEDPMGHTARYTYEEENLVSVTEPGEGSPRWQFKYNSEHEMTSMTDGRGYTVTTEYNAAHQVTKQVEFGKEWKWEYTGVPGKEATTTTISEPNGSKTEEEFNIEGEPTAVTRAYGTAIAATTKDKYNESSELTEVTDPDSHSTKYTYDERGDRASETNADGEETKWGYDAKHDVIKITLPNGEATTIKRNADGDAEAVERPAPGEQTQKTTYTYDSYGDVKSMTDPLERTWEYEYDTYGDRTSEIDPEGNKRTWHYNEDSQETSTVSPRGNAAGAEASKYTTKIERDAQGRPLTITDPLGHTTKYAYDTDGDVETITDGNSHKTTYTYNEADLPIEVKEPNGDVTETGYNAMGQVTSQTDGNKHVTKYMRNALGEVEEVVNPLGEKTLAEYNGVGDVVKFTDPAKRVTTFKYDSANRLTEVSYSSAKPATIKYEYNENGDRTKMTDGTGTSTYTYDQLDRMTESESGHKAVVKYKYDLDNDQTEITYPSGKAVTRAFDKDGRLEKVTDWSSDTTKFTYNHDSQLSATIFPSASKDEDTYAYNEADQLTEIKMKKGTETLASLSYTRDNDGQVKSTTQKGLPGTEAIENTYDEDNRLTKAGATEFKYDAANNPTTNGSSTNTFNEADELTKGTSASYSYNELGERTKTTPTSGPATTYGYDQAGNLISVERPKEGETPKIEQSYAYNGEGLRASETLSGSTRYLSWQTAGIELPAILTNETTSFIYGPEAMPIEQISSGGTITYLHHDQQGITRLLTGTTGIVTGKCTYSAYGVPTCEGTTTTTLGYDGQYTGPDTGLIDLRNRVYEPATAQFLSVDPLDALTRAPYNYADDNPVNLADPTGLEAIPLPAPVAGGCAAAPEVCGAAAVGGVDVWLGIKVFNSVAGSEAGDEGEAELHAKEAERESECGEIPRGAIDAKAALRKIARETGIPEGELSDALHEAKEFGEVGPGENTKIDPTTGDIYDEKTGEQIGNVFR